MAEYSQHGVGWASPGGQQIAPGWPHDPAPAALATLDELLPRSSTEKKGRTRVRSLRMAFVTVIAAVGLLGSGIAPASALEVGAVVFVGGATVQPGLCYPVLPPCNNNPTGFTWTLNATAVGASAWVAKPAPKGVVGAAGVLGTIFASGTGSGFCGSSTAPPVGTGNLTFTTPSPKTYNLSNLGWIQSVGGLIPVTGTITNPQTGGSGPIVALVIALPTTGSCLSGTATGFTVVGVATGAMNVI
jgi:hypothetical protein